MNLRLIFRISFVIACVFCLNSFASANGPLTVCQSPGLIAAFHEIAHVEGLRSAIADVFKPYLPEAVVCLERWVQDGGESDHLPIHENRTLIPRNMAPRMYYRLISLSILESLYDEFKSGQRHDPSSLKAISEFIPTIRSSLKEWPDPVRCAAYPALARFGDQESFAVIRERSKADDLQCRVLAWQALIMLKPDVVFELEQEARSKEEMEGLLRAIQASYRLNKQMEQVRLRLQERIKQK